MWLYYKIVSFKLGQEWFTVRQDLDILLSNSRKIAPSVFISSFGFSELGNRALD